MTRILSYYIKSLEVNVVKEAKQAKLSIYLKPKAFRSTFKKKKNKDF